MFSRRRTTIGVLASLIATIILVSVPAVLASGTILVTLNPPTSCTLYPLAGIKSCNGSGTLTNLNDIGSMCLSWSYPTAYFSVSVTGHQPGSPSASPDTSFPIYNGQCFRYADLPFTFTVTYILSTCKAGSYGIIFTGTKADGSISSATFTANVSCAFTSS